MDKGFLCSACHIQLYSFHFFSFFLLALFSRSVRRSFVSRRGEKKYCQCPQREFLWRLTGLFVTAWPQLHADNLCPLNWGGLLGVKQTFKFNQLQCSPLPPLSPPLCETHSSSHFVDTITSCSALPILLWLYMFTWEGGVYCGNFVHPPANAHLATGEKKRASVRFNDIYHHVKRVMISWLTLWLYIPE